MVQACTAVALRGVRRLAGALEGSTVLTPEMRREGWCDAHHLVHDERIYEDRAFVFFRWLHTPPAHGDDGLAEGLMRVGREEPGIALLAAAILEVPDESPVVVALQRLGRASVAATAGLTDRELEAWQLRAAGASWHEVACSMLISKAAAREYVHRAEVKIEAARRGLDNGHRGLSHTCATVTA